MRHAVETTLLTLLLGAPVLGQWTLGEAEWIAPRSVGSWINYGNSLGVDGDTLVVSHHGSEDQVFVFRGGPGAWVESQLLTPPHGTVHGKFDLAIDGDVLIVGDPSHDVVADGAGAAFVYERVANDFVLVQVLEKSFPRPYDAFGAAVAVEGDRIVVGAPQDDAAGASYAGAAYVYTRGASDWELDQVLYGAAGQDRFGSAVQLDGGRMAIGAPGATVGGQRAGQVHLFTLQAGAWAPEQVVGAADGNDGDAFGRDLALRGERLAVGAPNHDGAKPDSGRVLVFERPLDTWDLVATIDPPHPTLQAWFGLDVDLDGDRLLVTAAGDDLAGHDSGAAFVFLSAEGDWPLLSRLSAAAPQVSAYLGVCGELDGGNAYVGAPSYDVANGGQGLVMRFAGLGPEVGTVDCVADPAGSDCPCAQPTGTNEGCANSTGRGASFRALGSTSLASDDLRLLAVGMPPYASAWLVAGDVWQSRTPLGDGLLCVGGALLRLQGGPADRAGIARFGPHLAADAGWTAGDTRHFQVWYRDPASVCTGSNLTPSVSVTFVP